MNTHWKTFETGTKNWFVYIATDVCNCECESTALTKLCSVQEIICL